MESRSAFSVAIFAHYRGRVLLVEHRRLRTWLPVGGEIEPGETPLEAAKRELLEETGLEAEWRSLPGSIDGSPPGFLAYEEHLAGEKGLHMNFCFVAEVLSDSITPNDEVVSHQWVDTAEGIDCPKNVRELVRLALAQPPSLLEELARRWLAAFNAKDLDALLCLYAEDAVHTSPKLRDREPETNGEIRGRGALRAWWSDAMTRLPNLHYEERHITASGERVFMEYERQCPPEFPLLVAEVLVVEGGLIRASHVFHG